MLFVIGALTAFGVAAQPADADAEKPAGGESFTYRVTGLFQPDRADDLAVLVGETPGIELVSVNYDRSEATFHFDVATVFPGAKPDQILGRLENVVRTNSRGTFGILPRCTLSEDEIEKVEIAVVGLDCKGCSLGAYNAVYRIDGVERATASFKVGLVTCWIDPTKTNRAALEAELVKKRVPLKQP
ncbi:MAG: hypothetical protein RIC55_14910 [Pirellulaceae bacterium]